MLTDLITIASRKSPLAMWQSEFVQAQLRKHYPNLTVEIRGMMTQGDKLLSTPLYDIGGKSLFVKELEKAILEHRADIAVHSIKDMPVELPNHLTLTVIMEREDPRDAFVSNKYDSIKALPEGAIIGTSSLRRQALMKTLRKDLTIKTLRGNVGTRLKKLDDGQYDAIILAAAGLKRLGLEDRITATLDPETMLPGVGQGAICIECRSNDNELITLLKVLDHLPTRQCVETERYVTGALGGSCKVPLAAFATIDGNSLRLQAIVGKIDGSEVICADETGPIESREETAKKVVEHLKARGAEEIIALYA